ncbi:hypothetical protein [Deinococcus aquatilis]|uniref:hypothetical protein n=1 Tax=Deinococcus aquatilis TaxID=519440 RepID=UPI000364F14E|nr:hypothetical protein [Deinococcus aquatilis]
MITLALLLPVIAACWLGWVGWHSSGIKRIRVTQWATGLSAAGVSMFVPAFVVMLIVWGGANGPQGVQTWSELIFSLVAVTWISFGLVALSLANSWKTGFQIIGWGVLSVVFGLVPGILVFFAIFNL